MCPRNELCKKMVKKIPKKANKLLWIAIPLMIIGLIVVIMGLIQGSYDTNSTWVIGIVIMSGGWILFKITPKKN
jgi:Na+-driven multidrug efflux pump